ncbi:fungal-specific transcription factor domain-containing protein [Trichoderma chlorosporum]
MALIWKNFTVSHNPFVSSHNAASEERRCQGQEDQQYKAGFKFLQGSQRNKRRPKKYEAGTIKLRWDSGTNCSIDQPRVAVASNSSVPTKSPAATIPVPSEGGISNEPLSDLQPTASDLIFDEFWSNVDEPPAEFELSPLQSSSDVPDSAKDFTADHAQYDLKLWRDDAHQTDIREPTPIISGVCYQNLAHKYGEILSKYDEEFCVVPLSADCIQNLFRVPAERCESSALLLHAILATSSNHSTRKIRRETSTADMQNHWPAALQLFSRALAQSSSPSLLNTILILANFGTAQSASNPWSMHLTGALGLLKQTKATDWYKHSSRTRAQVAMLVWWDVSVALISRTEPILPLSYLDMLMHHDQRSFFALNGCPAEFLPAMARLAKLSAIYEHTTTMRWTIFDRTPVDDVIQKVRDFVNKEDATISEIEHLEDDPDARRNRFHCIEAWRHAILLYVCRVFNPKQDARQVRHIRYLARIILDSVRSIPITEIIQKELLLPVFLAASEAGDEQSRSFVRQYCGHWSDVSHFYHFNSTLTLLESIWSDWDPSTGDTYWWGVKVRAGHSMPSKTIDEE